MLSTRFYCASLGLFLLSACGQKPDGTAYGVNPAKHADGQLKTATDSIPPKEKFRGNKIPKAAELNAITNGARSGQPLATPSAQ